MSNVNILQQNMTQVNKNLNIMQNNLIKTNNITKNIYKNNNKSISKFSNNKFNGSLSINFSKVNNVVQSNNDSGESKGGFDIAGSLGTLSNMATVADSYINTSARLAMVNDGKQTDGALQDKVFQTAQRSGVSYQNTADMMSKMALAPGFNSNNEALSFTELAQKSMKIGGGSEANREAATSTLTDAMSSGGLSGEGFGNILQNAPMIAEAMASYTGKTNEELQSMAEQGLITADVIKNSMFASSEAIESKFQETPKTFQDAWTQISNVAVKSLLPLVDIINEVINSEGFSQLIDNICVGIDLVAGAILWVVQTIQTYWDFFGPLIAGMTIAVALLAIQWMAVCWPVLAVGAAIAWLIYMFNACGITFRDVFCFICGAVEALKVIFYNLGVCINNVFVEIQEVIYKIFTGIVNGALNKINEGLLWSNKYLGTTYTTFGTFDDYDDSKYRDYKDVKDAYNLGKEKGGNLFDNALKKVSGEKNTFKIPNINNLSTGQSQMTSLQNNSNNNNINNNSSNETDSQVNMSNKDKDYLREMAERSYINNFATTTLAPNISVVFEGSGNTSNDDKLAKRISKILTEQIAMVAEGVY